MAFTGFPADAFEFYAELERNQSKAWWVANKARYESSVRGPAEELAAALDDEFGPLKIFRPYKDVRFSADKRPYKDHLGLVSADSTGSAFYFQFSQRGMLLGGGLYQPTREQLGRFREIVDDNRLVGDLEATLEEVAEHGFTPMTDGAVATAPRGFRVDHPRIDLLRLVHLAVGKEFERAGWMSEPAALDIVRDGWRTVRVFTDWLSENLPSRLSA